MGFERELPETIWAASGYDSQEEYLVHLSGVETLFAGEEIDFSEVEDIKHIPVPEPTEDQLEGLVW